MNKRIILLIVVIISLLFILIPLILYINTDKEELQKQKNLKDFDGFILNISMCLYGESEANYEYIINNCGYFYDCEDMYYKDNNLILKNCFINDQVFSYVDGKVIIR